MILSLYYRLICDHDFRVRDAVVKHVVVVCSS